MSSEQHALGLCDGQPHAIDMHMSNAPLTAARDAAWLPHRYDPQRDAFHFRHVPRSRHDEVTFLTDQYLGPDDVVVARREKALAEAPSPAPVHFLFHSAYCCSTMLARAMNLPGVAMGLKEPVILNDLMGWRYRGGDRQMVAMVLDHSLRILARPFGEGEQVIIKPSNLINPLIPAIMAMRPEAKALLLFAPLEDYLASIARKGMWGRLWVRDLLSKLLLEGFIDLGIEPQDYLKLTDIQVAAVGWLAQQAQFANLLSGTAATRFASLNSEHLTARPKRSIAGLAKLFGLPLSEERIDAIVSGPAFTKNSKTGEHFAPGQRNAEKLSGLAQHAEEIEMVVNWAKAIAESRNIPMALPASLLG